MGSVHEAKCECGFRADVTVGGGMADYTENAPFPFYCERCGLVEVNTALEIRTCPSCGNTDVHQYGQPPASRPGDDKRHALQNFSFTAPATGNLCPKCKKMTLVFSECTDLFD
jgi:hypothetical protein